MPQADWFETGSEGVCAESIWEKREARKRIEEARAGLGGDLRNHPQYRKLPEQVVPNLVGTRVMSFSLMDVDPLFYMQPAAPPPRKTAAGAVDVTERLLSTQHQRKKQEKRREEYERKLAEGLWER